MRPTPRRLIHAALVLPLAFSALPAGAQEPARMPPRLVTVTGTSEASAKPDLAVTSLTVLRNAETAKAALDETGKAMADVTEAMKALGIEARDMQTSGFSISPQFRYTNRPDGTQEPPVLVGYEVRNTLTLRIRRIARTGEILDKAVTLGVNQGGDISFAIDKPEALRSAARRSAVEDATASARGLAEAAGVTLGPVVSIEATSRDMPPMPMAMARMDIAPAPMSKSVPLEAGETTVHAEVQMVFEIGPKSAN